MKRSRKADSRVAFKRCLNISFALKLSIKNQRQRQVDVSAHRVVRDAKKKEAEVHF